MKDITNHKTPSPSTLENQQLADDLNDFYCRFEKTSQTRPEHLSTQPLTPPATPLSPTPALNISEDDVRQVFRENKRRKAPGPDGVTPVCLKSSADQLAPIFTQIFNRSLELCEVEVLPRDPIRFLATRDYIPEYNAIAVGKSSAISTGAGGLTISRSQRPFRTASCFILIKHQYSLHSDCYARAARMNQCFVLFARSVRSMCITMLRAG